MNKIIFKKFFSVLLIGCFLFSITGCEKNSENSQKKQVNNSQSYSKSSSKKKTSTKKKTKSNKSYSNSSTNKKEKSNNGTYKRESSDGYFTITISGSSWRSKHVIRTGFGEAYDEELAQYDSGHINENDLYDSSGYIKLGFVSGNRINFGGMSLYK